jgi:hypothetical protein
MKRDHKNDFFSFPGQTKPNVIKNQPPRHSPMTMMLRKIFDVFVRQFVRAGKGTTDR